MASLNKLNKYKKKDHGFVTKKNIYIKKEVYNNIKQFIYISIISVQKRKEKAAKTQTSNWVLFYPSVTIYLKKRLITMRCISKVQILNEVYIPGVNSSEQQSMAHPL